MHEWNAVQCTFGSESNLLAEALNFGDVKMAEFVLENVPALRESDILVLRPCARCFERAMRR
jgi:hypothetical protein